MTICRRRLLGAVAMGAAGMALPRAFGSDVAHAAPLDFAASGIGRERFDSILLPQARAALDRHGRMIANRDVIGLVDFSAPSGTARFSLYDTAAGRVISTHLVAHGSGSDPANSGWVERLSNRPGSNASCEGAFLTGPTYYGKHGRSRRLIGLDPNNDMAESRAIVIHAARYVDPDLAATQGRVGRSQGCFAVSTSAIGTVLEVLGAGRLLYAVK